MDLYTYNIASYGNDGALFKFTKDGRLVRKIASGEQFYRVEACEGLLYVTIRNKPQVVNFYNDVEVHRFNTAGNARGVTVGRDAVYVSSVPNKVELFDTYGDNEFGEITIPGPVAAIDGIAVDHANNLIIANSIALPSQAHVYVYGFHGFGALIKTIKGPESDSVILDLAIGHDGRLLVADLTNSLVYMYYSRPVKKQRNH